MTVKLIDDATNLAEFADDMAQLGEITARDLALQYLDQNLADGENFWEAVTTFEKQCEYYV